MQNILPDITSDGLSSPESNPSFHETAEPMQVGGGKPQLRTGGGCSELLELLDEAVPRLVIRGESFTEKPKSGEILEIQATGIQGRAKFIYVPLAKPNGEPLAALTDYLNTTFPFNPSQETIIQLAQYFRLYLGEYFDCLHERKGGLHGYKKSFDIGKTSGMLAFGGQRDTALVSLPGSACAQIEDWHACYHLFHDILKARITRWDGAMDVFDGVPSVDDAVDFYKTGQFNAGGNKPSCSQQGNWIENDGTGRTFYIGKRKNGKLLRVYEKGKQLGDASSPWVRWELELHNRDRIIPWEVLLEPGKFLAAAYPCTDWISQIQERIRTIKQTTTISYEHLAHYAKQAYGPLINIMMKVEGSPEKVIERLIRAGVPARLDCGEQSPVQFINPPSDSAQD